jgi:hypothetical protein
MNDIAKEALFRRCADQCDTVEMMSRDMVGYQTEFEEFQRLHREIEDADIIRANCLMYGAAVLCLVICVIIRYLLVG